MFAVKSGSMAQLLLDIEPGLFEEFRQTLLDELQEINTFSVDCMVELDELIENETDHNVAGTN
jgi:hypothetical protein